MSKRIGSASFAFAVYCLFGINAKLYCKALIQILGRLISCHVFKLDCGIGGL